MVYMWRSQDNYGSWFSFVPRGAQVVRVGNKHFYLLSCLLACKKNICVYDLCLWGQACHGVCVYVCVCETKTQSSQAGYSKRSWHHVVCSCQFLVTLSRLPGNCGGQGVPQRRKVNATNHRAKWMRETFQGSVCPRANSAQRWRPFSTLASQGKSTSQLFCAITELPEKNPATSLSVGTLLEMQVLRPADPSVLGTG